MSRSHPPSERAPERVWLQRSQWRTVTALLLLLATVVVSLALVAGFWWTTRPRPPAAVRGPEGPAAVSVATITLPDRAPSVVELYPATLVRPQGPQITLRSPGGKVTAITAHVGQRVLAGQVLIQLEQPTLAAAILPRSTVQSHVRRPADGGDPVAAARLRRRLAVLQSEIAAAAQPGHEAARVPPVAQAAAEQVERARQALALATARRRWTDARYEAHMASRFQFHLARSGELVAQVALRAAEERAGGVRRDTEAAPSPANATAALQAERRAAALQAEARRVADRLARVSQQVAAVREQIPPPPAETEAAPAGRPRPLLARSPRAGIVTSVWASAGTTFPQGRPLLVIAQQKRPFIVAHVDQAARSSFSPGRRVTIRRRDGRGFAARVTRVIREKDGTAIIEAGLPRRFRWEPGAVLVPPPPRSSPPVLPAAAVQRTRTAAIVWIAIPRAGAPGGWIARHQAVRAVAAGQHRVALLSGVHPGDRVIVAGAQALREGQPVAPVEVGSLQGES